MTNAFENWSVRFAESGSRVIQYPSETLVRLMKGNYIRGLEKDYSGKKVLEVGFAYGANLVFMNGLGLELYGIEVHEDICKRAADCLLEIGIPAVLKQGTNRSIPFGDASFDYLVSWDTLHYEVTEEYIRGALEEFGRVLKPGGRLLLSTVAPGHTILMEAERLDVHRYRINENTFRKGEIFFCLDSLESIREHFSFRFKGLQIGRTTIDLFTSVNDCFVVTGIRS